MTYTVFIVTSLATVFFPGATAFPLLVNALCAFFIESLHLWAASFPPLSPKKKVLEEQPFVSVIVPCHNEPPALLIKTLESLSQIEYERFEVVVIDNNTRDSSVWKPIRDYSSLQGNRFRFFHADTLAGFKAGALNYALKHIDQQSQYVAVVDADYVVQPHFIATALSYFTSPDIALVQFPQHYRNATEHSQAVIDEYSHFFKVFMNMGNHTNSVLSTGTVSVYAAPALKSIKGFRSNSITEDADAGLRLHKAGFRGVYVPETVGSGLIPYDPMSYRKQKHRWAVGNVQSLKTLVHMTGTISLRSWLGFFANLTAWNHLLFLPFAVSVGYAFLNFIHQPATTEHVFLMYVVAFTVFLTFFTRFVCILIPLWSESERFLRAFKAFIVHSGMTLVYSESLFEAFLGTSSFWRTNKFTHVRPRKILSIAYKELILGTLCIGGAVMSAIAHGGILFSCVLLVCGMALYSILYSWWGLLPARWHATHMIADAEDEYRFILNKSKAR